MFPPAPTPEALRQDIAKAKTLGAEQILLSFGGANNTYEPNDAPIEELARNIVGFLSEFGFTGVDFDLEIDTNAAYLSALCHAIKQLDSSILITAAPQMNQGAHDSELLLVSTGYGGAMVWSINLDAETNYQFISAVKAIGQVATKPRASLEALGLVDHKTIKRQ